MVEQITPQEALDEAVEWAKVAAAEAEDSAVLAQAWALISLAASNLVPDPNEVYAHARADLEQETEGRELVAVHRLAELEEILSKGAREGRRHPAIHAALNVVRRPF